MQVQLHTTYKPHSWQNCIYTAFNSVYTAQLLLWTLRKTNRHILMKTSHSVSRYATADTTNVLSRLLTCTDLPWCGWSTVGTNFSEWVQIFIPGGTNFKGVQIKRDKPHTHSHICSLQLNTITCEWHNLITLSEMLRLLLIKASSV